MPPRNFVRLSQDKDIVALVVNFVSRKKEAEQVLSLFAVEGAEPLLHHVQCGTIFRVARELFVKEVRWKSFSWLALLFMLFVFDEPL